jgi:hypothetical protein
MKTEETQQVDKDGYILLPQKFKDKKANFELVKKLTNGWYIYKRSDGGFELVKPYKQESFSIAGNIIPKKWKYPSSEDWGKYGFTGITVEQCEEIFNRRGLSDTP